MIGLTWNAMMSMAGGWFFLMVSEAFVLGTRDFRLPGLGAYMSVAVAAGDGRAMVAAVVAMVVMIVALDQLLWRPVVVWAQKFRQDEGQGGRGGPLLVPRPAAPLAAGPAAAPLAPPAAADPGP